MLLCQMQMNYVDKSYLQPVNNVNNSFKAFIPLTIYHLKLGINKMASIE